MTYQYYSTCQLFCGSKMGNITCTYNIISQSHGHNDVFLYVLWPDGNVITRFEFCEWLLVTSNFRTIAVGISINIHSNDLIRKSREWKNFIIFIAFGLLGVLSKCPSCHLCPVRAYSHIFFVISDTLARIYI